MLFSENKLRELASLNKTIKTKEILNAINSIGFEVESCKKISDVQGIKFGHVLETYKNEKSDKLNVCLIEFEDKKRVIQTTANNVKKGDYLIAFVPGSSINGITFDSKEMKGIVSEGMLTSLEEIGFDKKLMRDEWKDGIFTFDKISLKKDPIVELGLDDNIIDISILTNRSDANSYIIMALELSAYFRTKSYVLEPVNPTTKTVIKMIGTKDNYISGIEANADSFNIELKDILLLLKTNIKLENDIKDLSSLALIMSGVSSRVYNSKKITSEINLKVKKDFIFNEKKFNEALIVTSGNNILSIAGVEESDEYKYINGDASVLFEFSSFDPKEVRTSARHLKISNDSSINCSKRISYGSIALAWNFISAKLGVFSPVINKIKTTENKIKLEKEYLNKYAGFNIVGTKKFDECLVSLNILGFKIEKNIITVPSYRHDIETMQDITEEIFRFYGLNNFEAVQPISSFSKIVERKNFEGICSAMGYVQFWTYTLVNKEKNIFNPFLFNKTINLLTFISEERNSIRNSIAPSLDNIYSYNNKRKINNINMFDIGMINNKKALCIASDVKSYSDIASNIFKIYGKKLEVKKLELDSLHPNYNAGLFDEKTQVGWIGKFHPKMSDNNIIFAEIIIDKIIKQNNKFIDYDNSPLKERDITISLAKNETIKEFLESINKISGIYEINKIASFDKGKVTNITFKIKMNDDALVEFNKKFNI